MDVARPHTAVVPTLDGDVLLTLARTKRQMTGREVARLTERGSQSQVNRVLRRLAEHGLVHAQEAGNAILYRLNEKHLASAAVIELALLRDRLFRNIRDEIALWETAPIHACIFGSAARGDGDTGSDIDLLIVRPLRVDADDRAWRNRLDGLRSMISIWTGNRAAVHEISETEVPALKSKPIGRELLRDGVPVAGLKIEALLRARRAR